jgi:hypothetical protein
MTNFSISVEVEDDIVPLSVEAITEHIILQLEAPKVLRVTSIVRDY